MKEVRFQTNNSDDIMQSEHPAQICEQEDGDAISLTEDKTTTWDESSEVARLSRLSQTDLNIGFPSSFTTQLMRITAEAAYKQEQECIKQSWETIRRSRAWRQSQALASKAARALPLLPIPNMIRNVLHEIQLICLAVQLMVVLWLSTQLDLQARLRGPFAEWPAYMAHRIPWIPGQQRRHTHVKVTIIVLCGIYLPCALAHFNYVLDDLPDETIRRFGEVQKQRNESQPSRMNRLVPFSCCKWEKPGQSCDHIRSQKAEQFYERGCVQPIVELLVRWMKTVGSALVLVFVLMLQQEMIRKKLNVAHTNKLYTPKEPGDVTDSAAPEYSQTTADAMMPDNTEKRRGDTGLRPSLVSALRQYRHPMQRESLSLQSYDTQIDFANTTSTGAETTRVSGKDTRSTYNESTTTTGRLSGTAGTETTET
ncbi:hypothetical protein AHF37_02321 [Paragonimus kellicotti]|nr:hypothetical protein AHF37_02321 [Paragonimus kellicotti]